jgi:AbrB family looped-hinge helix DNA binding protein
MHRTAISAKGRITIPAELRQKLRFSEGDLLNLSEESGRLVPTPIDRFLDEIQGFLKPCPGEPSAFEALFEERKRERMRERR